MTKRIDLFRLKIYSACNLNLQLRDIITTCKLCSYCGRQNLNGYKRYSNKTSLVKELPKELILERLEDFLSGRSGHRERDFTKKFKYLQKTKWIKYVGKEWTLGDKELRENILKTLNKHNIRIMIKTKTGNFTAKEINLLTIGKHKICLSIDFFSEDLRLMFSNDTKNTNSQKLKYLKIYELNDNTHIIALQPFFFQYTLCYDKSGKELMDYIRTRKIDLLVNYYTGNILKIKEKGLKLPTPKSFINNNDYYQRTICEKWHSNLKSLFPHNRINYYNSCRMSKYNQSKFCCYVDTD